MSNMSYCRFENTAYDLQDCLEHINDELDSKYEIPARDRLLHLCQEILDTYEETQEGMPNDDEDAEDLPEPHQEVNLNLIADEFEQVELDEIDGLANRGMIIDAVKIVRERSGATLKDALHFVDARRTMKA